ncbi:MAG: ABC transporter substrate-binding protein, partial [Bacteroidales bacterium]|nr:ABC transporter substrate-binding protein [Bacteroidales bacterium]
MPKLKYLSALIISLSFFISCHRSDSSEDKKIFRYNEVAGIATLDPAFAKDQALIWATSQIYNGLIRLDTNLNPEPCIAKSWTVSDDGLTYTFLLRDDVYFHRNSLFSNPDSTRKVVASDFVYSFNRILDPQIASPGLWIFAHVDSNGFQAPNDSTVIIRLKEPFAPMLSLLAMPYCSAVPHEVAEHYGTDFRSHPCGTGPFQFQYWKEGVKLVLRRNDNYFERDSKGERLPYLDAVAVTFIIDKQASFLEFIKGNLDFLNSIDASYKDEILTRTGQLKQKYASTIDMVSIPFLNTEYLGFNLDASGKPLPLKVRQAINYGFDRVKMMKYLRNNIGIPGTKGMIP